MNYEPRILSFRPTKQVPISPLAAEDLDWGEVQLRFSAEIPSYAAKK